ncbi:uncharacterized protein UTRI_04185 [Ustilago trichophora]|uniref:Uncharacterized protein n=1 Tax=Ustilago trichophora TaxID=86804 RepID=A0A5C3ESZ7_9BASI|nr:uncharacterized protein UTRI_04185 [Ustilago trichophora]
MIIAPFPSPASAFPLQMYRIFSLLVAQWRNDESVVDARQTIDRTRKWLEQSSDAQRSALDLQLVGCPQFWDLTTVAQNLVESLARAIDHIQAESQLRHAMLGLLGIVLDAFAELDWTAVVGVEKHDSVVSTAARLLIDMVWRKSCEIKIAVGILDGLPGEVEVAALRSLSSWPLLSLQSSTRSFMTPLPVLL